MYLFGFDVSGEAAWTAALFHPDPFAGVIIVSSRPRLPFARQLFPLLSDNLKDLPVLTLWPVVDASTTDARL